VCGGLFEGCEWLHADSSAWCACADRKARTHAAQCMLPADGPPAQPAAACRAPRRSEPARTCPIPPQANLAHLLLLLLLVLDCGGSGRRCMHACVHTCMHACMQVVGGTLCNGCMPCNSQPGSQPCMSQACCCMRGRHGDSIAPNEPSGRAATSHPPCTTLIWKTCAGMPTQGGLASREGDEHMHDHSAETTPSSWRCMAGK
jgi:hypothetical protein